jgi:hypothetical protein
MIHAGAQTDTSKWLRAFPITGYMVDLNDTVKVVQLEMPDGITIRDKQLGLMYGRYSSSREEAVEKGYGRCYLIKANYYYFAMGHNKSGLPLKQGDLLYTNMLQTSIYYGRFPKLAGHFIKLLDVYEKPFYDRYLIFNQWSADTENKLVDSLVADVQFTGNYFLENNPGMNVDVKTGDYAGKKVLDIMIRSNRKTLEDFLDYLLARPRLYAGGEWKISEIFATWVTAGAPKVVKAE